MSLSIVEFLNARLDAREAGARELLDYHAEARIGGAGATIWDDQDAEARDTLAEVTAHRKLIEAHIGYYGAGDDEHWPVSVLTILSERYGYDPSKPVERCCACGCGDDGCEGGPECVDSDEGFPLCSRW